MESERQKLLLLEGHLHEQVIGQDEAVSAVAAAIRRARAGMNDPGRPIGLVPLYGPNREWGKPSWREHSAAFLFDTEESLIRIDMSEYMEKHAVARLVGAPPGYVGYEEGRTALRGEYGGIPIPLFCWMRSKKRILMCSIFCCRFWMMVVSPMLKGHVVDFSNTVVVMTSNIGSDHILDVAGDDSRYDEMRDRVLKALRSHFRPEFLNRVDDLILFHPLRREELRQIVAIQVRRIEKRLADQKLSLSLSKAAIDHIAQVGYDPVYGARPLKRALQKELENPIATKILEEAFAEGSTIHVSLRDGALVFRSVSTETNPTEDSEPSLEAQAV